MKLKNVVLVDGARSAFGRGGIGLLTATRLDDAAATIIQSLLARNPKVQSNMIEDVGLGHVLSNPEIERLAAIPRLAGLPMETCNFITNRQCGF